MFQRSQKRPCACVVKQRYFALKNPELSPACPILSCSNLTSSHPSPHLASAGSFAHFWTREWNISILQRFFSCFSAVFSGRPPAGLTSVRTPRHAIPRTESEILSCKEEELTGGSDGAFDFDIQFYADDNLISRQSVRGIVWGFRWRKLLVSFLRKIIKHLVMNMSLPLYVLTTFKHFTT